MGVVRACQCTTRGNRAEGRLGYAACSFYRLRKVIFACLRVQVYVAGIFGILLNRGFIDIKNSGVRSKVGPLKPALIWGPIVACRYSAFIIQLWRKVGSLSGVGSRFGRSLADVLTWLMLLLIWLPILYKANQYNPLPIRGFYVTVTVF